MQPYQWQLPIHNLFASIIFICSNAALPMAIACSNAALPIGNCLFAPIALNLFALMQPYQWQLPSIYLLPTNGNCPQFICSNVALPFEWISN